MKRVAYGLERGDFWVGHLGLVVALAASGREVDDERVVGKPEGLVRGKMIFVRLSGDMGALYKICSLPG